MQLNYKKSKLKLRNLIKLLNKAISIVNPTNAHLWRKLMIKYKWWELIKKLWKTPSIPNVVKLLSISIEIILILIIGILEIRHKVNIKQKFSKESKLKILDFNHVHIKLRLLKLNKIHVLFVLLINLCLIWVQDNVKKTVLNLEKMKPMFLI